MTSRAFRVVEMFEEAVAEYAGAPYGVAMESCTMAIFLSLKLLIPEWPRFRFLIPARTYISVPAAIVHAGHEVAFEDREWVGEYGLEGPVRIVDSALRFRRGMYFAGEVRCVSFHARKRVNIGRGGMVLTDNEAFAEILRRARFDGRVGSVPFTQDAVMDLGWNAYMTPEQAARGLQLLEALPDDPPDIEVAYPDLREMPVWRWLDCDICGGRSGQHRDYCVKR